MSAVMEYLAKRGISHGVIHHDRTYTSIAEARALGVEADEVAKTILVAYRWGLAAMVIPASRRLDMHLVRGAVGDPQARLATEDEIERAFPDFEPGCLPPIPYLLGIGTYVDPELLGHERVVFAAGSQTKSVQVVTERLFAGELFTTLALSRHPEDEFMGIGVA